MANSNELAQEKSPYLLQHANNPVHWHPWGEKAFAKARREEKPIFLSIGYSTCHWCHVMEEESFEHPEIAKLMNETVVSVKVDREERPDVDQVYMRAVMAMTGAGGWPMSVFLTPDLKPFFAGTYFPPEDRYGRPGFKSLLLAIDQKWKSDRQGILSSGNQIVAFLKEQANKKAGSHPSLNENVLKKAVQELAAQFDSQQGGFGGPPKFPRPHSLSFLLRAWKRFHDEQALRMVHKTLQKMSAGGLFDHLGGGFHRYSTDAVWHVPHFEKMLYDQALIARAYLEAYQASKEEKYASVARNVLDYVLRDMTGDEGAFYSAEDADSAPDAANPNHKTEGAFYLWSHDEILTAVGKEKAEVFSFHYDVRQDGNAEHDPHNEFTGKNILREIHSIEETAKHFSKKKEEIEGLLQESKRILFHERLKRARPHLDDKILTDWNGLMIGAFALGSVLLGDPGYSSAAKKAADFLIRRMKQKNGRLLHRYRDGEAAIPAFLDDYAFLANGLIDLYEVGFEPRYLEEAVRLTHEMVRHFWDPEHGGFLFSATDGEKLFSASKEIYDGAIPSGNSVAALVLLRVSKLTMDRDLERKAGKLFEAFSEQAASFPSAYPQLLIAVDWDVGPQREIVIADFTGETAMSEILSIVYRDFYPNQIVVFHPEGPEGEGIEKLAPYLKNQKMVENKPTFYICKNYVCDLPVTDTSKLSLALAKNA